MSFWDFRRGVAGVRLLLEHGTERGLCVDDMLRGSRISAEHLADPTAEVLAEQELRVVENLARLLRHPPGLGLELGLRYRLATFGLWGYAIMSCATIGAALEMAVRFIPLTFAFSAIGSDLRPDAVVINFVEPDLAPGVRRVLVERDIAAAAALLEQVGGAGFRLERFELKATAGRPGVRPASLERIAGTRIEYDADRFALSFDPRHLAQPLPQSDPATATLFEQLCSDLMERRRAHIGTVKLIQHYLSAHPSGSLPSLSTFAGLLNTSERTLKRRMQQEGTTFRRLVAEVRAGIAADLVRDGEHTITEIAQRMGYADLSSFSQAFKRWHGVSPDEFRRGVTS